MYFASPHAAVLRNSAFVSVARTFASRSARSSGVFESKVASNEKEFLTTISLVRPSESEARMLPLGAIVGKPEFAWDNTLDATFIPNRAAASASVLLAPLPSIRSEPPDWSAARGGATTCGVVTACEASARGARTIGDG